MHIVVLTTSYPRDDSDPSGHFVAAEVRLLAAAGHRVTVLCPGQPEPDSAVEQTPTVLRLGASDLFGWPGVLARLRARPYLAVQVIPFLATVWSTLRRLAPIDRVIAHWLLPCGFPAALAARAPLEVVAHGSDVQLFRRLPRWARNGILRALSSRRATLRFVSTELLNQLQLELGSYPKISVRVAACPVEVRGIPARTAARELLGIASSQRLAVIVGRLVRGKRVATALRSLDLVPGCHTTVIGDGPERLQLERCFPRVCFTGDLPRPRALAWMSAADLLVSASRSEGAPTVIREARALGTPVVACVVGDIETWAATDPELWTVR